MSNIDKIILNGVIYDLVGASGGGGLSPVAQTLLIGILRSATYTSDQSTNITNLEAELAAGGGGGSEVAIVNNLTHCTNSNSARSISVGSSYIAVLTAEEGYDLDTVTVLMGGVDITASAYSAGTITIPNVTETLNITAVAISVSEAGLAHYWNLTSGSLVDTIDGETTLTVEGSTSVVQNAGIRIDAGNGHIIVPFASPDFKRAKVVFGTVNYLGTSGNNYSLIGGRSSAGSTPTKALRYSSSESIWETGTNVSTGLTAPNAFENKEITIIRGTSDLKLISIEFNGDTIVDGYSGGVGYNFIDIGGFFEITIKSIKTYTE